jgi:hypothetical protein
MAVAKHKGDDHPYDRGQGTDGRCSDQDTSPVLLEQTAVRFSLTAQGLQEQLAVQPSLEVDVGLNPYQDPLELFSQVQQPLYLVISGAPPPWGGTWAVQLVSVSC